MLKPCRSYASAIETSRRFAADGPRVAAVLATKKPARLKYLAACGYMDSDTEQLQQIALVTPDGRVWLHKAGL